MILTSYLDKLYLVESSDEYVASIQMLSHDKLKHHVSQSFLSHGMTFMSFWRLHYTITENMYMLSKRSFSFTACEVLQNTAPFLLHSSGT